MSDHENVGYLTWDEWRRFRTAVDKSLIVVPWFRVAGSIKGGAEEVRAPSSDHPLGLNPTWLAAEEISRLSHELRYWADLEDAANDTYGADIARLFTREVETALARWPIEDKPHKVRHVRCQVCAGETIRYRPPEFEGDRVHIACTECAHEYTEDEFKTLIELVTAEIQRTEKAIGGTRRMGAA
ncbi:hypothetical protein [Microbacterium aurugineum]|uniref:hypothetical protein n=1 Tax=Microbacterium aurugineum TaxID=2851642 RepID=UPI0020BF880B|nr:hypothetical protein [Microbacterium aurugineum]MCK8477216.1 hypothetical protein [Microbacterium aurugineum]